MRPGVSGLNLAGLLVQLGCAGVGFGLLAVKLCDIRIGGGLGLLLGLPLMLQGPGRTLVRSLFTFDRGIVHAPVTHARNIALKG